MSSNMLKQSRLFSSSYLWMQEDRNESKWHNRLSTKTVGQQALNSPRNLGLDNENQILQSEFHPIRESGIGP